MSSRILVYGAYGYTGTLVTDALLARGIEPLLCGRRAGPLERLATSRGLAHAVVDLADGAALDRSLREVEAVLHCAGPFSKTARPMIDACLRAGVHYLDVTGEIPVLEAAARRGVEARSRGVMVMPAVGFDVVPTDCLAAHVSRRLPGATLLRLAVTGLEFATRGSAKTLLEHADRTIFVRRGGALCRVPMLSDHPSFDFGAGPTSTVNVSWGDVATAYYTTGIPNIRVYFDRTPRLMAMSLAGRWLGPLLRTGAAQAYMKAHAELLPVGLGAAERARISMRIVAEATREDGARAVSRLRTPEAYTFTGTSAAAIGERVLAGDYEPGFQTPGRVYGPDFVLGLGDIHREDLDG